MRTVLFDTDPGIDDALALLFLHAQADIELVGITTVAGNAPLDVVTRNARYMAGRFGIGAPIARGAAHPLRGELHAPPTIIHGVDGLGDVVPDDVVLPGLDPRPAHQLIIDCVRARPHELTIVAVGMLTNVAAAIEADPDIVPLVRDVIVMGGAFGAGGRYGNVSPAAEANIYGDPHAAERVVCAQWPLTMIGLDVTERVIMTPAYLAELRDGGSDAGRFIWEVTRGYEAYHAWRHGLAGIFAHDPSAAVCALDDAAFSFRTGPVRVATDGIAVGMTVQKPDGRGFPPSSWDAGPAVRVALDVDAPRVLATFAGALN